MFGKKKPVQTTSALTANPEEPVHVFDQTNGVMKHFEEHNNPQHAGAADYEDTSKTVAGSVVGANIGGFGV